MKTNVMAYEDMPLKVNRQSVGKTAKKQAVKTAETLTTGRLLWIVIVRHRVGLLMVGNCILVLNWAFPMWTEFVKSIF